MLAWLSDFREHRSRPPAAAARLGLATRRPDPADGRAVLVEVTDEGLRFYAELVTAREEFLRERLIAMDETDRAAIEAALPALSKLLVDTNKEELISDER